MRVLLTIIAVAVMTWAIVEIIQANPAQVRRLSRPLWALVVLLVPLGALLWFWLGRPKVAVGTPGQPPSDDAGHELGGLGGLGRRRRYLERPAPDDDPEFIHRLNQQAEHRRQMRRLEDGLTDPPESPDADGGSPPPGRE